MARPATYSIRRLRALILLALVVGLGVFTITMLALVDNLSKRFGPQVRADLEWRARHGASELAHSADLGVAMRDAQMVLQAFGPQAASHDVLAIVAVDDRGTVIAELGALRPYQPLFAARSEAIVEGPGYLASWSPVTIEGAVVGKIAVAVSTTRLSETQSTLSRVSRTTLIAGGGILALGIIVILFFTRAVAVRDEQLKDHAANLERRVEERTRELDERNRGMRLVLDNVAQGFVTIDMHGVMANERSAIVDRWFGTATGTFSDLVRAQAGEFAAWLEINLDMIRDAHMPLEVCLAQMPYAFVAHGRSYQVAYSPITGEGGALERLLVIISDVTEQLGRERAERDQRELITVFQRIGSDRQAAEDFLEEAGALIAVLEQPAERVVHDRALHTLKGNSAMFGFERFAELCHTIETELGDDHAEVTEDHRARLGEGWWHVVQTITKLLGQVRSDVVQIEHGELAAAIDRVRDGATSAEIAGMLAMWTFEPVRRRFERLGQQAIQLAHRLGKGDVKVVISDGGVRLETERWAPVWSALVHAVRNAVDHGLEPTDERDRTGKGRSRLELSAHQHAGELVLTISDDGRGIDWDALRARATRLGLPAASQRDLIAAMFSDGVTTRDVATDVSGRGVGLAALAAAVTSLDGTIDVRSTPGQGTQLILRFAPPRVSIARLVRDTPRSAHPG